MLTVQGNGYTVFFREDYFLALEEPCSEKQCQQGINRCADEHREGGRYTRFSNHEFLKEEHHIHEWHKDIKSR